MSTPDAMGLMEVIVSVSQQIVLNRYKVCVYFIVFSYMVIRCAYMISVPKSDSCATLSIYIYNAKINKIQTIQESRLLRLASKCELDGSNLRWIPTYN